MKSTPECTICRGRDTIRRGRVQKFSGPLHCTWQDTLSLSPHLKHWVHMSICLYQQQIQH